MIKIFVFRFVLSFDTRGRLTNIHCPLMYDVRHLCGMETLGIEESKGGSSSSSSEAKTSASSSSSPCKAEVASSKQDVIESNARTVKAR